MITTFNLIGVGREIESSTVYPESKVLLDPTCTLEQILLRAQYGMAIPQRDVSGDITNEELQVLGISGNSLATMTRMEIVDLRMRAQMRMNALKAKQLQKQKLEQEEALRKGAIEEYIAQQKGLQQ